MLNERIFDFLDVSFGTLWWVREDLWKAEIRNYQSTRHSHPGLSVTKSGPQQRPSYVQMLHGTTGRPKGVAVRGMTFREPERICYFGQIRPVRIEAFYFTTETRTLREYQDWTPHAAVLMNHHKPRINRGEREALEKWIVYRRERQPWWGEGSS